MCLRTQVACAYAQLLVPMSPCGQEAIPPPPLRRGFPGQLL